jgi:UDP-N-acetylmuramyl pentapeptide phosphotransferase/UDP-N-acetylglucosamine-1-phosphate transferase
LLSGLNLGQNLSRALALEGAKISMTSIIWWSVLTAIVVIAAVGLIDIFKKVKPIEWKREGHINQDQEPQ